MKYFDSILMRMDSELLSLIKKKKINHDHKLAILGLDEYSFAVRTLLANRGYKVECYVSEDEEKREYAKKTVNHALSHYFNHTDAYIRIFSVAEWSMEIDKSWIVLYASEDCSDEISRIQTAANFSKENIFCLYDWKNTGYKKQTEGLIPIAMDELKSIEKGILFYFDQFCAQYNLRYWLSGGSMLGAVRHQGFIPWDDDIDVFMPDVDYEKFLRLFREDDKLKVQIVDDENDVWGHYKFARLADKKTLLIEKYPFYNHFVGINIEILPIVGLPKDRKERTAYMRKYKTINIRRRELFFQCSGNMDIFKKMWNVSRPSFDTYQFDNSEYVGVLGTGYYEKDCTKRSIYDRTLRMPFEDIEVNVPQGYAEYLDNLYGKGWEQWPPESERTLKHNIEAYWL